MGLNKGLSWMERVELEIRQAVSDTGLDLRGCVVLTEAATGPFAVTPVIAAVAGARRVLAVSRTTRHGTASEAFAQVEDVALRLQVGGRIEYHEGRAPEWLATADIITNSGHVRPLDAEAVALMKPSAAISLMYEGWEWRPEDVDLEATSRKGIPVAGVSERHPAVAVFSYLGPAALELIASGGLCVSGLRVLLICDNPFLPFLEESLRQEGAKLYTLPTLRGVDSVPPADLVVLALKPESWLAVGEAEAGLLAAHAAGAPLVQFWGDVDRQATERYGIRCLPAHDPGKGRMGILLSDLGPEPAIRLQTGGLKVGELLHRGLGGATGRDAMNRALAFAVESGYGMLPG